MLSFACRVPGVNPWQQQNSFPGSEGVGATGHTARVASARLASHREGYASDGAGGGHGSLLGTSQWGCSDPIQLFNPGHAGQGWRSPQQQQQGSNHQSVQCWTGSSQPISPSASASKAVGGLSPQRYMARTMTENAAHAVALGRMQSHIKNAFVVPADSNKEVSDGVGRQSRL